MTLQMHSALQKFDMLYTGINISRKSVKIYIIKLSLYVHMYNM